MASVWQHLKQQWSRESGGRIWSSTPLMTEALPRASPEESGFHPGAQSEEIGDKNVRYLRRNGNLHLRTSKNMCLCLLRPATESEGNRAGLWTPDEQSIFWKISAFLLLQICNTPFLPRICPRFTARGGVLRR
jgi:hypothetical protein